MSEPAPRKHVRQSVSQDPVDYTPKNILVTGGAGFIASHIVIRLTRDYPQYKVSLAKSPPAHPCDPLCSSAGEQR